MGRALQDRVGQTRVDLAEREQRRRHRGGIAELADEQIAQQPRVAIETEDVDERQVDGALEPREIVRRHEVRVQVCCRRVRPTEDAMADSEMQRRGAAVRKQLLGEQWVEQTSRTTYADPVMRTFIDVVTETVFGALWTRPGLDLKTRTLICVVSDAATGHDAELAIHLRMALRQGWTEAELTEALLHLLGYVGAPAARDAMLVASRVFAEVRREGA
jgi:4-carboxymuconolactone decarboxylase